MIEPHMHCAECHAVIETTVIAAHGKRKPRPVHGGTQPRAMPTPQGIQFVAANVPLCDECFIRIQAAEQEQQKPKLIVPELHVGRGNGKP